MNKPPEASVHFIDDTQPEAIKNKNVPWHVRRQMLETEDRKKAELLRAKAKEAEDIKKQEEAKKSIDALEKKVGIQPEVIGEIK